MRFSNTVGKVLEEFSGLDTTADRVATIISENQYIEHFLFKHLEALSKKETRPSLSAAIALMGMQSVRNIVCAIHYYRQFLRQHPPFSSDGKPSYKAADLIKFAIKTEEYVQSHHLSNADTAFAAGYVFDMIAWLGRDVIKAPKSFEEALGEVYKNGLKSARIAVEIYKTAKLAAYSRHVFGAALLRDVGKLVMELIYDQSGAQNYASFRAQLQKRDLPRELRYQHEHKTFGITHDYVSSVVLGSLPLFADVENTVLFHHEPFLAKGRGNDLYRFSQILCLASNVANTFRAPKDANDPVFETWLNSELLDYKANRKDLIVMMSKIGNDRF